MPRTWEVEAKGLFKDETHFTEVRRFGEAAGLVAVKQLAGCTVLSPFPKFSFGTENWCWLSLHCGSQEVGRESWSLGDTQNRHVGGFLEKGDCVSCAVSGLESKTLAQPGRGLCSYSDLYRAGRRVGLFCQGEVFFCLFVFLLLLLFTFGVENELRASHRLSTRPAMSCTLATKEHAH